MRLRNYAAPLPIQTLFQTVTESPTMTNKLLITLIVLATIEHNGVRYPPGAAFEIDAEQAQPLVDCGAARFDAPTAEAAASEQAQEQAQADVDLKTELAAAQDKALAAAMALEVATEMHASEVDQLQATIEAQRVELEALKAALKPAPATTTTKPAAKK
jgi:pyruvate/2-oxoglutarate dehydrogenase complex dihydrolipoamide acyltransferase (E2) component